MKKAAKKKNFPENTDFQKGCKLALENAKNHFAIAEVSKEISLGIANSHLILASEEASKALILYNVSVNKDWLNHTDLDQYFRNHKFKHLESHKNEFFGAYIMTFLEELTDFVEEKKSLNLSEEEILMYSDGFSKKIEMLTKRVAVKVRQQLDPNKKWWESANEHKNLGFYVNLDKLAGTWSGPFDIMQEQFDESVRIVSALIKDLEMQLDFENSNSKSPALPGK